MKIKGQVALVTGANRGIGKAILEVFLAHGAAKVYAAVRDPDSVAALVAAHDGRVVPLHVDLSKADTVAAAAKAAGDVGIVVNNAGILKTASPLDGHCRAAFPGR